MSVQNIIFTSLHKVVKKTCDPKISENVFSSLDSPEKLLNEISQMSGTLKKKDHLGIEKNMVT
jgi:hypothetical protein